MPLYTSRLIYIHFIIIACLIQLKFMVAMQSKFRKTYGSSKMSKFQRGYVSGTLILDSHLSQRTRSPAFSKVEVSALDSIINI